MVCVTAVLLVAAVTLGLLYWDAREKVEQRDRQIAGIREQFAGYWADDQRLFDALWSRAQIETARALRSRGRR
jgi:hypothetical protein